MSTAFKFRNKVTNSSTSNTPVTPPDKENERSENTKLGIFHLKQKEKVKS